MYYTQEQIDRANQADLVSFLQSQGEQLTRAGNEYRWKRHDSLTVRGNKWYRHSQSKGGGPVDFVIEFFGKSFTEAVELLTGEKGAAPPPDRPCPASLSDFRLPPPNSDNRTARNYLTAARRIDEDVTGFFFARGDIYEDAAHHNAVFVGRDEDGIPRYAHSKGTAGNFRLDVKGSDKAFNFCYRGEGDRLFAFEAPVDLLSFLCLFKKEWQKQSYLSLGGVGEKALLRFLSDRPNIKTVYLCLDSDQAGNDACSRLAELVPEGLTVHRLVPLFKDWNEVLQHRAEITDGKYIQEAVYGLKEPPQEETVEIIRMSEVDTQTVEWLWEPYIPFGKVTIVQGNPGEGKTTFALRLAAACTTGGTLPGMKPLPPFQVIYQTAEDGLGDTVKPRLIEAEADLDRVLVIDEAKRELTLSDERIEKAITQNGARLIILDPIQAYMGEKTDMNRANEVRPMFRRLADVAERTGCAVILIGHLNKAAGGQSAYRGLGSIDFRAAARSVLLIGRVKREPNVRVIVHDKSSLAPEGKPVAFCLDPETGFSWILVLNTAKTKQKLDNIIFQTAGIAQKYNCALKRLDFQQEQGLMSSLPIGLNQIDIQRGLTTSATAIFVPFTTEELFQGGEALYYGINAISNNMIMADRKQLKNPNGLILGTPGSGKSFSAKREMTNAFLITDDDIIICDPEGEYSPLVSLLKGQVIHISPNSKQYVNPMDINLNYSEDESPISLKADFILSLCELIVGSKTGLEPVEKTIIDRCVRLVYRDYLENPTPEHMPVMEDLYNCILDQAEPEAKRIATALEIYVKGSLNVFNHRTNVDISNRLVCFDIKELGKQLKKIGMLVVQDQVWNRVTINRAEHKATRYYMDEFHLLLKDEQTAAYSVEIWKRFRKWGGIPTGITQNVKDLLSSREIENIFENSDFVYMLNQAGGDRQILAKQLNISPHQLSFVTNSNEGEALQIFHKGQYRNL